MMKIYLVGLLVAGAAAHGIYQRESNFIKKQPLQNRDRITRDTRDITTNCAPGDPIPPNRVNTTERLADLRLEMENENLDGYIVPWDEEGRRAWISGFTGSAGDAIIIADQAALWTDGRYWIQAADQLDCNWELMRDGDAGVPSRTEWLIQELPNGARVGADPSLIGAATWLDTEATLAAGGVELISVQENLVDRVWTEEDGREPFVPKDLVTHPIEYAGQEYYEKLDWLRQTLSDDEKNDYLAMVLTEQDEIAWMFNMRAEGDSVVESLMVSPLFKSFALVTADGSTTWLWLYTEKVTTEVRDHLESQGVVIKEYDDAMDDLTAWASEQDSSRKIFLSNPSMYLPGASYAVYEALPEEMIVLEDSPILFKKSTKNSVEAEAMVASHLRDAYAKCKFLAEIESDIVRDDNSMDWTEMSAAERLSELRREQDLNRGDSFTTIAASGTNAAIIHYAPTEETNAKVNDSAVFMVDSGGQYLDGTTDVTRTMYYGDDPSLELIDSYTRVLMGVINLAMAVFPAGTLETNMDYSVRKHLFSVGQDYNHGTGHGVGAYLSVHEGPVNIRMSEGSFEAAQLKENMFISDEPGYYVEGEYGVRIENVVQVVKKTFEDKPDEDGFLTFDTITLIPYEPKLIDFNLMTFEHIEWYNEYNTRIREQVLPYFEDKIDVVTMDWIYNKTAPVEVTKKRRKLAGK